MFSLDLDQTKNNRFLFRRESYFTTLDHSHIISILHPYFHQSCYKVVLVLSFHHILIDYKSQVLDTCIYFESPIHIKHQISVDWCWVYSSMKCGSRQLPLWITPEYLIHNTTAQILGPLSTRTTEHWTTNTPGQLFTRDTSNQDNHSLWIILYLIGSVPDSDMLSRLSYQCS